MSGLSEMLRFLYFLILSLFTAYIVYPCMVIKAAVSGKINTIFYDKEETMEDRHYGCILANYGAFMIMLSVLVKRVVF